MIKRVFFWKKSQPNMATNQPTTYGSEGTLMKFYTADGCAYEGMDQDTVIRLRTELGRTTIFVDQATYEAYVAANQPVRL